MMDRPNECFAPIINTNWRILWRLSKTICLSWSKGLADEKTPIHCRGVIVKDYN